MCAKRLDILVLTVLTDIVRRSEFNRVVNLLDFNRRSMTEC